MVLACRTSPRLADAGVRPDLDPFDVLEQRRAPAARVICSAPPTRVDIHDLGWRVCGQRRYRPATSLTATRPHRGRSRARRRRGCGRDPSHRVRLVPARTHLARACPATSSRGHGPNREAGPMTATAMACAARRRDRAWVPCRRSQRRRLDVGRAARRSVGRPDDRSFDPSRVDSKIAAEVTDFDPSAVLDRKEMRRAWPLHPVRARGGPPGARPGRPARRMDGALAERTGVILGSRLMAPRPFDNVLLMAAIAARTGSARSSFRWASRTSARAGRDRVRHDRPELRDGLRLRDGRPRDRRGLGDDPPRRRRHRCSPAARGRDPRGRLGGFWSMNALSTRNDDPEAPRARSTPDVTAS